MSIQDKALIKHVPDTSCYYARRERERERARSSMVGHGTREGGRSAVNGLSSESAVTHVRLMWLELETCLQSQGLFNTYFKPTHIHTLI